ncbi:MAG: tyrosine-type recombinase/integrase [bacterium]
MKIFFFIRTTAKSKDKPKKIRVRLRDGANVDIFGDTQQRIAPKKWSTKTERPNFNSYTSKEAKEYDNLKTNLNTIEKAIEAAYQKEPDKTSLDRAWLNKVIDRALYPQKYNESLTFFQFIEKFIKDSKTQPNPKTGRPVSYKQRRLYEQTYNDLQIFAKKQGKKELSWQDINLDFYHDFMNYLNSMKIYNKNGELIQTGLATNTVGKRIQTIKVFLNSAKDKGYDVNPVFQSHRFKAISEESESIYLNENELTKIFNYDFSDNPRLERVRDLFIISAWTGLRFGDVTRLTRDNIEDDFINIHQSKTGDPVIIPLHWTVKFMLDKYNGELPEPLSNQKFNDYLKELCQIVGINEPVHKGITKGGQKITKKYKKYELVTAHTGRRSFATNLYKQGFPALSIMQITGHKSEQSFLKYIKVTPREHAEKLKEFWSNRGEHIRKVE